MVKIADVKNNQKMYKYYEKILALGQLIIYH